MAEVIQLSDTIPNILVKMSEGNPGALSVLMEIIAAKKEAAIMLILTLDNLDIRGQYIWVGFKDYCEQDLEVFCNKVQSRDQDMIDFIEKERQLYQS